MEDQGILFRINGLEELEKVAKQLLSQGEPCPVWLFFGEMGVGKTTLIKKLCELLGVENIVQSPTFSIINEFLTGEGESVYHFDFYRLRNETEAYDIGTEEYLYSGDYCFVEWPEKIESLWPETYFEIVIQLKEDGSRVLRAKFRSTRPIIQ